MTTVPKEPESADAGIEELLREVGARNEPSPDAMQEVRAAVQAEWHSMVDERRRQRRVVGWRIAASLMLAILIATFAQRFVTSDPVQVATVAHVSGELAGHAIGASVMSGETLQTDAQTRAALTFPSGLSLRLDRNTRIEIAAADTIALTSGALYIDSPSADAERTALTIETHAGSVRHLGTQYEIRTEADGIVVSVREGRVMISSDRSSNTGHAGEMLQLNRAGELIRHNITATDPRWQWAVAAAPAFDIDNQSLAAFLQWIARETGRRIVYSSPAVETAATAVKLRGSIAGLDVHAALNAVLATTQLRRFSTSADKIGIELTGTDSAGAPQTTL